MPGYWKIDRDYLDLADMGIESRVGTTIGERPDDPSKLVRFRVRDDDNEVYYGGEATDDALEDVMAWTMKDAGATELDVRQPDGSWKLTIA